ncbi:hypothetical protein QWY79_10200 [Halomonas sabkhae]|uniref:hypothetical protein n=1 Tax=Halomonas sabkhae TaxID=626223 RepID=UPI0025B599E0|nr:hypothetical protein [Halomonas sabkhae]MDN3525635.1 hypothetical protein [Halomonas sabkhae]
MTYVLKDIPDIWVDVEIPTPGLDEPEALQARWRLHSFDDYKARVEQIQAGELTDEQVVEDDLLELSGAETADGKPMPHCQELVDDVMSKTYARKALVLSWYKAQEGRAAAATKN